MSSSGVEEIEFTWKIENCDFMWFETFLRPVSSDNYGANRRMGGYTFEEFRSPLISVGNPRHSVFCVDIFACISSTGEHLLKNELVRLRGSLDVFYSCEVSIVGPNGFQKIPEGGINVDEHFFVQETLTLQCLLTFSNVLPQDIADVTELNEKINKLFLSGEFSDLTLYTKDKEFFVHKFLLYKRAPKLLEDLGVLYENRKIERVKVDNLSTAVLQTFLQYIYSGKLDVLPEENRKIERVKVDNISTAVLQTFLQYIYSGKLDVLPEENMAELCEIVERNQMEEYNDVIHLNKFATIITQLKVIRRIICCKADAKAALNEETIFFERINFECANFFIKVSLKITAQKLQIQTRVQCLSSLDKDILMSCITSSGMSKNDLKDEQKLMLLFSASNSKQAHNFTQYLKYRSQDINSGLHLQFNLAVSKGRYFNSVDGMTPILPGNLAIFGTSALGDDMQQLGEETFFDEDTGDVTLRLNDDTLRGHKAVLAAWSPVFSSMFHHDMKEKNSGEVDIPDIDYETGVRLHEFMYSGMISETGYEEDAKLYAAADKYQVSSLFAKCSSFLASHLAVDNACDMLVLADLHSDENLLETVQNCIATNLHDILDSRKWLSLIDTHPRLVSKILHYVSGN